MVVIVTETVKVKKFDLDYGDEAWACPHIYENNEIEIFKLGSFVIANVPGIVNIENYENLYNVCRPRQS